MKKTLLSGLLFLFISGLLAQDLKKVKTFLDAKQLDKAKTEIDAYNAKNPNNPEGLYYKGKIYGSMASNDQFKSLVPDGRAEAFEAFKKAIEVDKENKLLLLMVQDQYKPIFDLYTGYYDAGIVTFNTAAASNNKADFEVSMNNFMKANEVGSYIFSKKWALSEIDTSLVLIIGKAAMQAGNREQALQAFKKLTDADIYRTKDDSTGYSLPYQWLAFYYKDAKDEANFLKYANLGNQKFPGEDIFEDILLDFYRQKKDYKSLYKQYDETLLKFPDSSKFHGLYATDLYNYLIGDDTTSVDKSVIKTKFEQELKAYYNADTTGITANDLYGRYYFYAAQNLQQESKLVKDVKLKQEKINQAKQTIAKAIPYFEKEVSFYEKNSLKIDKSRYKTSVNFLSDIYGFLQSSDKEKIYQAKYDTADDKFVK